MFLVSLPFLVGCNHPVDTDPTDTGSPEWCELDLDSPWSFGKVHLPFEAAQPGVTVVANRLVLAGGYYDDPYVEEVYVGTTDEAGLLTGWEVLASIPEGSEPFRGATLPASSDRLVLYGGLTATGSRQELLWAESYGDTLGDWDVDRTLPEPVVDSAGLFTQDDLLLVLGGGLSGSQAGGYAGCWTTTFSAEGPTDWESLPELGTLAPSAVASTRSRLHVLANIQGEVLSGPGFATAELVEGVPAEWAWGRTPASATMGSMAIAEGHLFTGPSEYRDGEQHVTSAVLYSDANDPFDWYYLPDLPLELGMGRMVAHDGYLYVMGGVDGLGNSLDQVFSRPICADPEEE